MFGTAVPVVYTTVAIIYATSDDRVATITDTVTRSGKTDASVSMLRVGTTNTSATVPTVNTAVPETVAFIIANNVGAPAVADGARRDFATITVYASIVDVAVSVADSPVASRVNSLPVRPRRPALTPAPPSM